ncbi:uncharacterized protein [Polyergus mexicanus]|uniref:uncharacterized protein n=1 Tax=Polyergus mexicanus TaxID=615972 RepID=UPI0038B65362
MKDKLINDDEIMISLDVTALFTNIPKQLVLRAIEKRWNDIAPNTNFNLLQFLYAVKIVLDSTSFSFNGQFYEQIFGSLMGSPLSPILADIVMDDLETHCLSLLNFIVPVYYRYVDDIFAIVPRAKVDEIKLVFNSYHQRLKFTHETESDSCINFLDTTVIRCDGLLQNYSSAIFTKFKSFSKALCSKLKHSMSKSQSANVAVKLTRLPRKIKTRARVSIVAISRSARDRLIITKKKARDRIPFRMKNCDKQLVLEGSKSEKLVIHIGRARVSAVGRFSLTLTPIRAGR